jgi:lipoic acid synthetase
MAELVPIAFEIPGEVERPRSRGRSAVNERVPIDRARPEWLKVRLPIGPQVEELRRLMRSKALHTVCEEAHCPNMAECWGAGTATFMILGDTCTRSCGFCVVTSVNRDELEDGGARMFAETIGEIRRQSPGTSVEVLIPDFRGVLEALETVLTAQPEILNHNVETVPRLYPRVRPQARFERSLEVLRRTKERAPTLVCKTGIMVGLGESKEEVLTTMRAIAAQGTDVLTIGQYLRPSPEHLPIERYWTPAEFDDLRELGMTMGFDHVESGPLVRSSYHAERHVGLARAG